MRRILRWGLAALALVLAFAAGGLGLAHLEIRGRDPELPSDAEVLALVGSAGSPSVSSAGSPSATPPPPERDRLARDLAPTDAARQGARPGQGPRRRQAVHDEPTSFALAWPDGRLLLVDLGMERDAALAFGRPLEWVGAQPAEFLSGAASALGPAAERVAGVIFTHLHTDHVEGVLALCAARSGAPLPVFQTAAQAELANYTTRPGRSCSKRPAASRRSGCPRPAWPPSRAFPASAWWTRPATRRAARSCWPW